MHIKEKFDCNKLYFTSDQHFGHANIIKYCKRKPAYTRVTSMDYEDSNQYKNIDDMHEDLIHAWNEVVPKDGIVFQLGDFFFKTKPDEARELYNRLNGTIYWIKGNHDHSKIIKAVKPHFKAWREVEDYIEIMVKDDEVDDGMQRIVMMHYPILKWNHMIRGSWMLYGHVHGTLDHPNPLSFDVGVDSKYAEDYKPFSYQRVKEIITERALNAENKTPKLLVT